MYLPVRPPIPLIAEDAEEAAFETEELAELVTLDRPSDAFETCCCAVSLALEATSAAFSVVEEACLNCCRRRTKRDCRRIALDEDIVADIAIKGNEDQTMSGRVRRGYRSVSVNQLQNDRLAEMYPIDHKEFTQL